MNQSVQISGSFIGSYDNSYYCPLLRRSMLECKASQRGKYILRHRWAAFITVQFMSDAHPLFIHVK